MSSTGRRSAVIATRIADRWFRELGLPTFVPLRRWFTDLPRRVAPLLVWVTVIAYLLEDGVDDTIDVTIEIFGANDWAIVAMLVLVIALSAAAAWIGYLLARALLRRLPPAVGTVLASLLIVGCIAALVVGGYLANPRATVSPAFQAIGLAAVCVLIIGIGGGAFVSWASRLAIRNASAIGHMASIALPVILMLVVFAFFSAEVWQMASALRWPSLALVGAVVGALAVLVVLRVCASEIDDAPRVPEERTELLVGTPAEDHGDAPLPRRRLGVVQRANILLVMAFAQLLQALFFAFLLWVLLVLIGSIAIPIGVVELWVGPGSADQPLPVERLVVGNAVLPITVNLIKAAALLSLIATLPFVFSAVSEERYRERFFDPIMADMRRAIAVRDALAIRTAVQREAVPASRRRRDGRARAL
ncbi:MFS family permease [Microbacterium resistens]|uniref:MFS family permease n=1 Tax=Microbacterium resistens TaxID=156977 RepID=A0ABU1SAJ5_9MICO|nr:hypothetical protein [Microbacterium resistens]MDR6866635.1 MFS family permease [Microbacterium resistens]